MIKAVNRADAYAYRRGNRELASSVTALNEGQWVTFNTSGNLVKAVANTLPGAKAFLTTTSLRTGRDEITGRAARKATYLYGAFELWTDQYDATGSYTAAMTPLKLTAGSVVTPATLPTDAALVVAYAIGAPVDGFLCIMSV